MDTVNLEERYICALQDYTGETNPDTGRWAEGVARLHSLLSHFHDNLRAGQVSDLCECLEAAARDGRHGLCATLRSVITAISLTDFDDVQTWLNATDET